VADPTVDGKSAGERSPVVTLHTAINHRSAPDLGHEFTPGSNRQVHRERTWLVPPGIMAHVSFL
jgi:hypothetical protein